MTETDTIIIYCDGASRGNPGPAAAGFVVTGPDQLRSGFYLGETTNNVAEYQAVIAALNWIKKGESLNSAPKKANYLLKLDSQLVVRQLAGQYRTKDLKLKKLLAKVKRLEQKIKGKVFYKQIPRKRNQAADQVVNEVLYLRNP